MAVGIHGSVQLAPGPAPALAVPLPLPLTGAIHFQPGGVNHDRDRLRWGRQGSGPRETDTASRKGGVVRNGEVHAEPGHYGTQQTFRLAPRSTKGEAQQVPGLDGQICIERRPAAPARGRGLLRDDRFGGNPHG